MAADSEEFMAQKFTSLEDAANQLGISKDRLNSTSRSGQSPGLPRRCQLEISLRRHRQARHRRAFHKSIPARATWRSTRPTTPHRAGWISTWPTRRLRGPASDINLEEIDEPTVAGIERTTPMRLAIDLDDDSISLSDSILLSEAELGASPGRPPSTIIGRGELDLDADLDLSPAEKQSGPPSDVHPWPIPSADLGLDLPSPSGDFAGLEEVEVDLEAESSRILSPEEIGQSEGAAAAAKAAETSDLELAPTDSDSGRGDFGHRLGRRRGQRHRPHRPLRAGTGRR